MFLEHSPWHYQKINKMGWIQHQCLWRKNGNEPAPSFLVWDTDCRPQNKGCLGIMNLKVQNEAH